jgi:hypothetical protein
MEHSGDTDPVSGQFSASYELTAKDLAAMSRAAAHPLAWWTSGAFVVVLILGALIPFGPRVWSTGLLVALLVVVFWVAPRRRRALVQLVGEGAESIAMTVVVDPTSVTLDAGWTWSSIRLDRLSGYSIGRRAIVLLVKNKPAVLVPREKVSQKFVEALVARLGEVGVPPVHDSMSGMQRAIRVSLVLVVLVLLLLAYGSLDDEPLWPPNPVPANE